MTEKNKPIHKIRGAGGLSLAIWKHESDKGPWFSVTLTRSYKQGEEWKESNSYGFDDLLNLAKMLDQAHTWITEELAAAKMAQHGQDAEQGSYTDREAGRKRAGGQQR
jgi:hypothetical protein